MTLPHLPRAFAGLIVAASAALVLAGCAGESPEAAPSTPASTVAPPAPEPEESPSEEPEPLPDPTCETIISSEVVEVFEESNWSYQEDVFRVGATEVPGGIACTWGDVSVASDHVQMFGWAPIDSAAATQHQNTLLDEGWVREEGDGGVYITENPNTVSAPDDDGYGWTYLFGDGWVKFADTRQGIVLVEWPPA